MPPSLPASRRWARADNLLVGLVLALMLAWGLDLVACRLGLRLGAMGWLSTHLDLLGLAVASVALLVGLILVGLRRPALRWFVVAGAVLVVPRLVDVYAPAGCVPG